MAYYRIQYVVSERVKKESDVLKMFGDLKMLFESCTDRYLLWGPDGALVPSFESFLGIAKSPRARVHLENAVFQPFGIESRIDIDLTSVSEALRGWDEKSLGNCPGCEHMKLDYANRPGGGLEPRCNKDRDMEKGRVGECTYFMPAIRGKNNEIARPLSALIDIARDTPSVFLAHGIIDRTL